MSNSIIHHLDSQTPISCWLVEDDSEMVVVEVEVDSEIVAVEH